VKSTGQRADDLLESLEEVAVRSDQSIESTELAELRQANERLRRKLDFLYDRLGLQYTDDDVPLYVLHAQELIRAGQYGDALRVIREHTAVGIVEARAMTVDLSRRLGAPIPTDEQLGAVSAHNPWADLHAAPEAAPSTPSTPSHWTVDPDGTFAPALSAPSRPTVDAASIWRD
jgi:hypothetical protein